MANNEAMVPIPEAATIAGISIKEMNRAIDEHIFPETLYDIREGRRVFRFASALARFYFMTFDRFTSALRKHAIEEISNSILSRYPNNAEANQKAWSEHSLWIIREQMFELDLWEVVMETAERSKLLEEAREAIVEDPEIMSGVPVFRGTRVPVCDVAASVAKGIDPKRILDAYPSLGGDVRKLQLARLYTEAYPSRGRPKKVSEKIPGLKTTERFSAKRPAKQNA